MKKLVWMLLAPGLAFSSLAARGDDAAPLAQQTKTILQVHCAGCHGGGKAKGSFGFVLDRDRLVSRLLVVPGKAGASDLFLRMQQGEMPPRVWGKEPPSQAELKIVQRWIDAGAPAFDRAERTVKALSPGDTVAAVLADLQTIEPRQRRFMRYVTLSHLAQAGRPDKELALAREAAGKLLNSLSWHPRLSLPEPVDTGATILRFDLRSYKWSASAWEKLVTAYPYRLQTATETRALASLSGTEVPAVRGDWLVATASRPPFYHDLFQLPGTDRALERLLQVDVPGDIADDNILRAGFNDSGVSKNNRLLERHDAAYGALWRSYDFANNTGRQNLFEHPLGPHAGATSFQAAGGEVIFHLPNGLQGFMLVDAAGRRIDKAPSQIVADPRRPDQRVENGISCMSCHALGLLPKADQMRGHVEKNAGVFGKEIVPAVRATHPRPAQFKSRIEDDNVRYLKVMEKLGQRDPDQEPINLVTQRFEGTLDGRTAAGELGLSATEFARFLKEQPDLSRIFGTLLTAGGTVQRESFQENFAELSRRLLVRQAALAAKSQPAVELAFSGHTGTVNCVAISSDGKRAASGGDDNSIRIWELPGGKSLGNLQGKSGEVYAVAFSTDGKLLVSAGRDRLVRLWDLRTAKQVRSFQGHTDSVRAVAFSPDGRRVISGGDDRSVRLWDIDGTEIRNLVGHAQSVTSLAWAPDGRRVLSGSRDGTLRLWDLTGKRVKTLEGHVGPVFSVALSADGGRALSAGNDKTVRYWNLSTGKETHCFKGHANAVIHVQFDAGGRQGLSSSSQYQGADDTWRRWDLIEPQQIGSMSAGEEHRFGCAAFSPDGRHILVGGPGGFLRVWSW
jgi:hypothetical protein